MACHQLLQPARALRAAPRNSSAGRRETFTVTAALTDPPSNRRVFVYLPLSPAASGGVELSRFVAEACLALPAVHCSSSWREKGHHVSLSPGASRDLSPDDDAAALADTLRHELKYAPPPRVLPLCTPAVAINEDRTRTFLTMEASGVAVTQIACTIAAVNRALEAHQLPHARISPLKPHVSVAWAWGDVTTDLGFAVKRAQRNSELDCWQMEVGEVKLSVGAQEFTVWSAQ